MGLLVLLSPMCALEQGRAWPPVTDLVVWARSVLCVRHATQGLIKAFVLFGGNKCSNLPSGFPCSCSRSAFFKFIFSMVRFLPLSTRA